MNICEAWKNEIKALLPCGFVKISRDGAFLFVSDYPKRVETPFSVHEALTEAGFCVTVEKGMAYLDGSEQRYRAAEESVPLPPLPPMTEKNMRLMHAARLLLQEEESGEDRPLFLIRHVLRCCALKDEKGLERLHGMIAQRKREKKPLSPLAGKALLTYISEQEGGCTC